MRIFDVSELVFDSCTAIYLCRNFYFLPNPSKDAVRYAASDA